MRYNQRFKVEKLTIDFYRIHFKSPNINNKFKDQQFYSEILNICGVEKIYLSSKYYCEISIAKLYNKDEVIQNVLQFLKKHDDKYHWYHSLMEDIKINKTFEIPDGWLITLLICLTVFGIIIKIMK